MNCARPGLSRQLQGAGMFVCEPPTDEHSPEFLALMEHLAGTDDLVRQLAERVDDLEKLVRRAES